MSCHAGVDAATAAICSPLPSRVLALTIASYVVVLAGDQGEVLAGDEGEVLAMAVQVGVGGAAGSGGAAGEDQRQSGVEAWGGVVARAGGAGRERSRTRWPGTGTRQN